MTTLTTGEGSSGWVQGEQAYGWKAGHGGNGPESRGSGARQEPRSQEDCRHMDYVYAYALSKILTKISSPATVGLYSSCQDRASLILEQMEEHMNRKASKIEQKSDQKPKPRAAKPSVTDFMALIGRLLFFKPVWTTAKQPRSNIRFIYVHFSAWHFTGSDLLWAGIALRLFRAMQMEFGKLQLALYRVAQQDEEDEIKKKVVQNSPNEWSPKKICGLPLWLCMLSILVIPAVLLVVWIYGLPKSEVKPEPGSNSTNGGTENDAISGANVLEHLLIASLGLPAVSVLKFIFQMGKNLIFSQELNIRRSMDNDRISSQLGFMNEVRKEMWSLSQFIQFMEVFERRRIRVVLKITNLDRCSPRNIVAVLEAINILLSDDESPLLSILAVNPSVLLEKVNSADGCICREDRAYALLNRIVTLAFTVPPMCEDSKKDLFHSLIGSSRSSEEPSVKGGARRNKTSSSDLALVEVKELKPLMDRSSAVADEPLMDRSSAPADEKEKKMERLVWEILRSSEEKLNKYMSEDTLSMKRTINSVWVTLIIMKALKLRHPNPETIPAWVVLANQWPCRLSWIIQCVEDAEQRADIDQKNLSIDPSKTLWEVFSESREELYVMSAHIEDLLEQDGDPELFEELLRNERFEFTLNNLKIFKEATVNMDQSIRRELALNRGTSRLKDSGWMRNIAPLPVTSLIKMSTADVCKEMERMKFDSKYINIVKEYMLDGSALVFGDVDDLKALLGMTFGEWVTFRLHFLSLPPHRQAYKNKLRPSGYSMNQLPRFLQHIPSHSSSLGNSCI